MIAVIAAEIFGLQPEQITVRVGDTQYPPSGGSGGSTTVASVSPAIYDTCQKALDELQKQSGMPDVRGEHWKAACTKLGINPILVQGKWIEGLSSNGVGGVQFAEVAVDTETGFVQVRKITCVQDCGLIVSRLTCESQVNGGIMMGLGYALYEERVMDRGTGVVLNPNLETYKLPGSTWHIGAGVTLTEIENHPGLSQAYPGLREAVREVGFAANPQRRHAGWQSGAAFPLLVFPPSGRRLLEKRRRYLSRKRWRKPIS